MSDELFHPNKERFSSAPRHLSTQEMEFLGAILRHGRGGNEKLFQLQDCMVRDVNDEGMGSLYFESKRTRAERKLGRSLVEVEFRDHDGVLVSAVVNLDSEGELFELDVWKVDFSPLLGLPRSEDIVLKSPPT